MTIFRFHCLQQFRLVVDRCDAATTAAPATAETDSDWSSQVVGGAGGPEDRRACEARGESPGEGRAILVNAPLQLGGRANAKSKYPANVLREGFNGCIKNVIHNGEVRI